ncbi:MAG: ADP-ribosylglycohydrolase [Sulfobacillus acidophilus]|uniref:ADP-ribosylglycohydrolase n=1 Tax=Sulfobacillus acidophilus TaxID=53633 RepID=A0A2T2WFU4_9FIRM|nr:MAG: ADP-ribosylglycohydrolase [Sulfobacillus acidophilus]
MPTLADRALAALYGLALGDALGMPTQSLPRSTIVSRYGPRITQLEAAPSDHPIAAGLAAGHVTDDTEQALLLGELLVSSAGLPNPRDLAQRLLAWEQDMRRRGSHDLLGPSTTRALQALMSGVDIGEAGRYGATNGAAMRITPIGIMASSHDLPRLVDQVESVSRVSHNTNLALSAASAIAAAVSAGIDGATVAEATELAISAAELASRRGYWVAGADVAARIRWACSVVTTRPSDEDVADLIYRLIGTSLAAQESIPAAFAVLAIHPHDPWTACQLAASLGGDTDTIAAMVGAVAGACLGLQGVPETVLQTVLRTNRLELTPMAQALCDLRLSSTSTPEKGQTP